ncbi:hypothetical protein HDV02_005522 [Globomyces sp. JEL0801]|nr:hypothetical protein HDV02_005522 [Globomyces sp. JEL0801]
MRQKITQVYKVTKSQDISKIAGQSWALEPDHIKNYYYQLSVAAHLERVREASQTHIPTYPSPSNGEHNHQRQGNSRRTPSPSNLKTCTLFEPVSKDIKAVCSLVDFGVPSFNLDNICSTHHMKDN